MNLYTYIASKEDLLALMSDEIVAEVIVPEPSRAWAVLFILNDYTLGHALRVAHATREPQVEYPGFDGNAFPHLAQALLAGGPERDQETFEAGLEVVLDAIERRCQ
jgi:hypothetical protein